MTIKKNWLGMVRYIMDITHIYGKKKVYNGYIDGYIMGLCPHLTAKKQYYSN
jgi:hypothetical protein